MHHSLASLDYTENTAIDRDYGTDKYLHQWFLLGYDTVEVRAQISSYTPLFCVDVIAYSALTSILFQPIYVGQRGPRPHFYQTRSAWSVDQGSNKNHSPAYNFALTVTKFCVMWEGLSLPHDTKFGNCRCKIVDSRSFPSWSLIHGLRWSGLIKVEPGVFHTIKI